MTSAESQLAAALRQRREIIADEESRRQSDEHVKRLRDVSVRIEQLTEALPRPIAPAYSFSRAPQLRQGSRVFGSDR